MRKEDFKRGGLYLVSEPSVISRLFSVPEHGYLWVGVNRRSQGGDFKSVATGVWRYFNFTELTPVEKEE